LSWWQWVVGWLLLCPVLACGLGGADGRLVTSVWAVAMMVPGLVIIIAFVTWEDEDDGSKSS